MIGTLAGSQEEVARRRLWAGGGRTDKKGRGVTEDTAAKEQEGRMFGFIIRPRTTVRDEKNTGEKGGKHQHSTL